jgi:hypothetical protein
VTLAPANLINLAELKVLLPQKHSVKMLVPAYSGRRTECTKKDFTSPGLTDSVCAEYSH